MYFLSRFLSCLKVTNLCVIHLSKKTKVRLLKVILYIKFVKNNPFQNPMKSPHFACIYIMCIFLNFFFYCKLFSFWLVCSCSPFFHQSCVSLITHDKFDRFDIIDLFRLICNLIGFFLICQKRTSTVGQTITCTIRGFL